MRDKKQCYFIGMSDPQTEPTGKSMKDEIPRDEAPKGSAADGQMVQAKRDGINILGIAKSLPGAHAKGG